MKMTSSAGSFQDPQVGTFPAVCVRVIDLGTQENEYEGKKTSKRQLMLGFELHGESVDTDANGYMLDEAGKPDPMKPFMVSAWLTASFHEEATLRKYMESWRGAPYSEQQISEFETDGFDWSLMLGVPCMIRMEANAKGKVKIKGISKLQKNIERPVSVNQNIVFILDEFDPKVFESIPQGIRDIIVKSPEWKELNGLQAPATGAVNEMAPFDDDQTIPF
ncbi:phage replication initiation protein, NGO0469 family [Rhizobium ruizarguesonis]